MKDAKQTGIALGATFAGLSAVCGILLYSAPGFTLQLAGYLTHSTIPFTIKPFDAISFVIGLVLWGIIGFVAGFVFVKMLGNCKEP